MAEIPLASTAVESSFQRPPLFFKYGSLPPSETLSLCILVSNYATNSLGIRAIHVLGQESLEKHETTAVFQQTPRNLSPVFPVSVSCRTFWRKVASFLPAPSAAEELTQTPPKNRLNTVLQNFIRQSMSLLWTKTSPRKSSLCSFGISPCPQSLWRSLRGSVNLKREPGLHCPILRRKRVDT